MTRQEAIERIGGRKRAAGVAAVGCLMQLLLVCGLLFGGVGWVGGWVRGQAVPEWGKYEPYQSYSEAADNCGAVVGEEVLRLWRGWYGCSIDRDAYRFGGE